MLVETHFLASGNHFFHCLRYFSRSSSSRLVETHFSVQKKKYCFLLRTFFPASGNHYLNYREAYLKLLSLLCFFTFQTFLPMLAVFSSPGNVFIKKFSIPASVKRFSLLETIFFYLDIFFLLVEIQFLKNNLVMETDFLSSGNSVF